MSKTININGNVKIINISDKTISNILFKVK